MPVVRDKLLCVAARAPRRPPPCAPLGHPEVFRWFGVGGVPDNHPSNEPVEIVIELDHSSDDGQASEVTEVTEVAEITEVAVEPIAPVAEAAPAGRRRGRRAAGRPAGAPATASEPVDIIVRESLPATIPDGPPAWDSGADGSNGHAANGNGELPAAAANGEADQLPGDFAATAEPVAATSPPRRRRAASRPAGPAAGVAAAEPLIVSIPAEQQSS